MSEELDRICCVFAGLERLPGSYSNNTVYARWKNGEFPAVSTDWAAAGRLMDALGDGGILVLPCRNSEGWSFKVSDSSRLHHSAHRSGPMALALAVAELAKSSGVI